MTSGLLKPCPTCGDLTEARYCPECRPSRPAARTDTSSWRWIRLAQRARATQPWCLLCGATAANLGEALQCDHSPRAWSRSEAGLKIRLVDVSVLCRRCNVSAGSSKPGSARHALWLATGGDLDASTPDPSLLDTQGGRGSQEGSHLRGEAKFRSQLGMTPNKGVSWL